MEMSGAELILSLLSQQGIETVTGIPGGTILPLYDALSRSPIRHILARHEQGAAFIAQGIARSTGKPAVCFATSGPGATNLITALADAHQDSVPLVAITAQVPTGYVGTDAFQEVDIYHMTVSITKHNFAVRSVDELTQIIPAAFAIAASGRPGPVLIDIPKDIFTQKTADCAAHTAVIKQAPSPDKALILKAAAMLSAAQRPVICAGGGIISGEAHNELLALAQKNSIPVALTLMGLGGFPQDNELCLGMIGMHGAAAANRLIDNADLLIAVGARFGDRTVGKLEQFCPHAAVIHIDIDEAELGKLKNATLSIRSDCATALHALTAAVEENSRPQWRAALRSARAETNPEPEHMTQHPSGILRFIRERLNGAIVTTDVGQHQMWAAQIIGAASPRHFLTSGGLGTMGFGLPAAIGAAVAHPEKKVICITGDGSILMNIQELATLADLGSNVTVILLNNGHLGLVRQQQELFYGNRIFASRFPRRMNFAAIARGFGIQSRRAETADEIVPVLEEALSADTPFFAEMCIDQTANVFPMVPPGSANTEMIGG